MNTKDTTSLAAMLYHQLYKSNFYTRPMETQRQFELAVKCIVEELQGENDTRN
jgi:hypothetical protein